jgi:TetR/AcrR family transcriptional regulator, cholesterol catabolism regulator
MVETRRRQIEDTASGLFRERGYAATSVRDIARALDIQGASLYAHVASKEDVLWAIVTRAAERFDAAVAPIAGDAARSAADRLAAMIRAHVGVVTDDLGNAVSFLHEWRFLSDGRKADIAARRDGYEGLFRTVITEGVTGGEFVPETDPRLGAILILSALNGVAGWFRPNGDMSSGEIGRRYATMLLDGLRGGLGGRAPGVPTPSVPAPVAPSHGESPATSPPRHSTEVERILR